MRVLIRVQKFSSCAYCICHYIVHIIDTMPKKDKKFQLRLSPTEYRAMMLMASRDGIKMSQYLRNYIRAEAKKRGIPV